MLVGVVGFLGSEVVLSPVVSGCLSSCGGWGVVGVAAFLGSEVVLSPVFSGCLPLCGGWVLVGVAAFLGSEVVLSPVVSGCLPSCGGWVLVVVAASRTKTFRNQNHRFQSKFAYCKLFGVYAGVILGQTQETYLNREQNLKRDFASAWCGWTPSKEKDLKTPKHSRLWATILCRPE